MNAAKRPERLEGEIGGDGRPCAECERREQESPRAVLPYDESKFEEVSRHPTEFDCRGCGRPYIVDFVAVYPRGEGGSNYERGQEA